MIAYEGWDREYHKNKQQYLDIFDNVMKQANYENVDDFEKTFAEYIGRKHAVGVANATDALHFSLLAHGVGKGDEVLVSDFSWISTASCISLSGAIPVFCDIDFDSYHISLNSIKRMISRKTKALVYTHLFGNMTDTSEIESFCKQNKIALIEDSAQSLGSSFKQRKAGTIGDSSSFSFNTNKVVAGINGGGMYLTDNDEHAEYVKKLRKHGKGTDFEFLGYNSKLYTLNAEIINFRFQKMSRDQSRRQEIAQKYNQAFEDLPIRTQKMHSDLNHNYHKYVIKFDNEAMRKLAKDSLSASIHYEIPLSDNSMYKNVYHRKDNCKNSKKVANTVLSLPIHAWLTANEISTVIESIRGVFE